MALRFSRRFPDEVILEIIRQVDDSKTLASISRASHRLHGFAESYLYSVFAQVDFWGEAISLFLRTLLRKPHLGRYVKTWIGMSCDATWIPMEKLDDEDLALLKLAARWVSCGTQDIDDWIGLAVNGHWDTLAAVLLCLLPNLEEIEFIEYGNSEGFPYVESVLQRAAQLQETSTCHYNSRRSPIRSGLHHYPEEKAMFMKLIESGPDRRELEWPPVEFALAKLQRVSLSYYEEDFPRASITPYQILPFLNLKSVARFQVHMLGNSFSPVENHFAPPIATLYTFPLPKFKFTTSELVLTHSALSGVDLEKFMNYFTALKRFEYNFDYDFEAITELAENTDCVPPKLTSALAHLVETLEELSITQEKYREKVILPQADQPIEALTDFKQLRKLTASANMLLGRHPPHITLSDGTKTPEPHYQPSQISNFTQLFPPNLEHLIIRHCDSAIFPAIVEFLHSTLPPKLKMIELEFREYCDCGAHYEVERTMEHVALHRGISIKRYDQAPHSCIVCFEKWARWPKEGNRNVGDWSLSQQNWFEEC